MKTRKIILLAACAFLLCVCIAQGILSRRNPIRTAALSESPDTILIENGGAEIRLSLDGGSWYIDGSSFKAAEPDIDAMIRNIREVKILDAVGKSGSESAESRYELDGGRAISVAAMKGGAEIRSLKIGKASSTGAQTFITLDGGKDVFLASGNLRSTFGKSADDLRSKVVYSVEADEISAVSLSQGAKSWGVARAGGGEGAAWAFSGAAAGIAADDEKVDAWVQSLASLSASAWLSDGTSLPSKPEATVLIAAGGGEIVVSVYNAGGTAGAKFICTSNQTPNPFEISSYLVGKFKKTAEELSKQ